MPDILKYPEQSYSSWEYRQERLSWEDAYHSTAVSNNWSDAYRKKNGSYSCDDILKFICDHTVNAEYKDYSSSPYYIRVNHTFPVPEFKMSSRKDQDYCKTILKKKFINSHQETNRPRYQETVGSATYNTKYEEGYPHNSDDWYEDYMNSTHTKETGSHKTEAECKNSRLLDGLGNDMLKDLIKNHGGHLNLVYEDYTDLDTIPKPTIRYSETYGKSSTVLNGFDRVYLGNPIKTEICQPYDVTTEADKIYRLAYTAFNTDAVYGSLCEAEQSDITNDDVPVFSKTGTLESALTQLFRIYNDELRPNTLSSVYPHWDLVLPTNNTEWDNIKDNPCSIFVGDSSHSLQHILDYILETFGLCVNITTVSSGYNTAYIDIGIDNNSYVQTINFGKNLLDYSNNTDCSEIVTAVCPYMINTPLTSTYLDDDRAFITTGPNWHNEVLVEGQNARGENMYKSRSKYVYNKTLVEEYGWITDVLEFDYEEWIKSRTYTLDSDAKLGLAIRDFLTEQGDIYLKEQLSKTCESFSISAVDLAYMGEKDVPLHIGDLVRCVSLPHNFDKVLAVTEMKIDFANPDKNTYTLGDVTSKKSISHIVSKNIDKQS